MPELPEVEAARRAVEEHCLGKKIKKAIIANDTKVIDSVSASDFEAALLGKTIISAHRKGKNLWLHLDSPPFPSFQFGTLLFSPPKNPKFEFTKAVFGLCFFIYLFFSEFVVCFTNMLFKNKNVQIINVDNLLEKYVYFGVKVRTLEA